MNELDFSTLLDHALLDPDPWSAVLELCVARLGTDGGTVHQLTEAGLELRAFSGAMPPPVLATIRLIPVGKGMAGLAVERAEPVTACNLQTDDSGDVRPGARQTGLQGSIVVPILDGERPVGALGVGSREERTFDADEIALLLEAGRRLAARA